MRNLAVTHGLVEKLRRGWHQAALLLVMGCQVSTPGPLKTKIIQETKRHITIGGGSDNNPLQPTAENIHAGQAQFHLVLHGMPRTGWSDHRRPVRRQDGAARPRSQFCLRAGVLPTGSCAGSFRMEFLPRECLRRKPFFTTKKSGRLCSTFDICRRREASESRKSMAETGRTQKLQKWQRLERVEMPSVCWGSFEAVGESVGDRVRITWSYSGPRNRRRRSVFMMYCPVMYGTASGGMAEICCFHRKARIWRIAHCARHSYQFGVRHFDALAQRSEPHRVPQH